jgi:hypothetical protein
MKNGAFYLKSDLLNTPTTIKNNDLKNNLTMLFPNPSSTNINIINNEIKFNKIEVYNYAGTYSESFIVELAQSSAPTTVLDMKVVSVQVTVTGGSGGSSGYVVTVTNGSQINYWFNNGYLLNFGPQQVLNGEGASATFGYWTFDIAYIAEPIATSIPLVTRVSFCDANQIMVGRSDGAFNNVTCMTMKPEYFLADLSYHAAVWDLNSHIACPPNKVLVGNTYDATWGPDRPWGTIISHCAKIIHRTN